MAVPHGRSTWSLDPMTSWFLRQELPVLIAGAICVAGCTDLESRSNGCAAARECAALSTQQVLALASDGAARAGIDLGNYEREALVFEPLERRGLWVLDFFAQNPGSKPVGFRITVDDKTRVVEFAPGE
jgi:hypothetical protein